jgi:hypothetical protein
MPEYQYTLKRIEIAVMTRLDKTRTDTLDAMESELDERSCHIGEGKVSRETEEKRARHIANLVDLIYAELQRRGAR